MGEEVIDTSFLPSENLLVTLMVIMYKLKWLVWIIVIYLRDSEFWDYVEFIFAIKSNVKWYMMIKVLKAKTLGMDQWAKKKN